MTYNALPYAFRVHTAPSLTLAHPLHTQHKAEHDWSGRDIKLAYSACVAHAVLSGHTQEETGVDDGPNDERACV